MQFYYLTEGKIKEYNNGNNTSLASEAIAAYKRTVQDIHDRREWKATGAGARFMGMQEELETERDVYAAVEALATGKEKLVYAVSLENTCGIYTREKEDLSVPENYITKKPDMRIYHLAYSEPTATIAASYGTGGIDKHIALCDEKTGAFRELTEGDSIDIMPAFSKQNTNMLLFSSAGFYIDNNAHKVFYGSYVVNKLNLTTYEMEEILADEKFDFLAPTQAEDGTIYCIRRPKTEEKNGNTVGDVLMVPVKVAKSVFGWLNVFSQRYSGETLLKKSQGNNPAKQQGQNEAQLFIEGNLINAEKELQENALKDTKAPGIIPQNWQLISVSPNGSTQTLAQGVSAYCLTEDGSILVSNGKYLKELNGNEQESLCEVKLAKQIAL